MDPEDSMLDTDELSTSQSIKNDFDVRKLKIITVCYNFTALRYFIGFWM